MTNAGDTFEISADRMADNGNSSDSFHVRSFSDRADAERYLDELVVRFEGSKGQDEHGGRCWSIREAGVVTRYSIGPQADSSAVPVSGDKGVIPSKFNRSNENSTGCAARRAGCFERVRF